jgi:hypothetical protein
VSTGWRLSVNGLSHSAFFEERSEQHISMTTIENKEYLKLIMITQIHNQIHVPHLRTRIKPGNSVMYIQKNS